MQGGSFVGGGAGGGVVREDGGGPVLEGGPDSDLLPIPWHNPQGRPTQPVTLGENPACQQSIRSIKYS